MRSPHRSAEGGTRRPDPAARRQVVDIRIAAGPEAAGVARAALVTALGGQVGDRVLADAALLVSELVSNSVRHAGLMAVESVRVGVEILEGIVRLEVDNPGTAGTIAVREPDLERGGGFGLRVVDALADAWGTSRDGHTRVWIQLALSPATR